MAQTRSMLERWGRKQWGSGQRFAWVISEGENGDAIGLVLLIADDQRAEIHFGIAPQSWGRGLATEALQAVMTWIETASDIDEVATTVDCEHSASAKVLSKAGFTREDLIREHLFLPSFGASRDCWRYSWKRSGAAIDRW